MCVRLSSKFPAKINAEFCKVIRFLESPEIQPFITRIRSRPRGRGVEFNKFLASDAPSPPVATKERAGRKNRDSEKATKPGRALDRLQSKPNFH